MAHTSRTDLENIDIADGLSLVASTRAQSHIGKPLKSTKMEINESIACNDDKCIQLQHLRVQKTKSQMQSQFIAMSLTFWLQNSHRLDSFNHFLCEKDKKGQKRNNAHRVTSSTLTNLNVQRSGTASHLLCAIRLSLGKLKAKNECDQTKNRFHHFSSFTFQRRPYNYNISTRFSLGMRFTLQVLAHIQHASSYGVRAPTSRALIGRRKRLLCIAAASSSGAYDAICAAHFERV